MPRVSKMTSKAIHLRHLQKNLEDISKLLEIHALVASTVSGRANSLQVINKSSIVLLTACWEAFIEDLATSSFDWLLSQCREPTSFPAKVRTRASSNIRQDKNELAVWELAGNGWKNVLRSHRDETIQTATGNFNTPKTRQIDLLYESLLGLTAISSTWKWPSMTAEKSRDKLEKLVVIRGNIAHRVRHDDLVRRPELEGYMAFVSRLAVLTHHAVVKHLIAHTGQSPWQPATFEHPDPAAPDDRRKRMKKSWPVK